MYLKNHHSVFFFAFVFFIVQFTISGEEKQTVQLFFPPNNEVVSVPATLQWKALPNVESYRIQILDNNNNIVEESPSVTGTSYTTQSIQYDRKTYFWKVAPAGTTNWSSSRKMTTWNFCTPISPSFNASVSRPITFSWNPKQGTNHYYLEVWPVKSNGELDYRVFEQNVQTTSVAVQASQLREDVLYAWSVTPYPITVPDEFKYGPLSLFTITNNVIPSIPKLTSPVNTATNCAVPVTLNWQQSTGAKTYTVQVSKTPDFAQLLVNDSVATNSYKVINAGSNTMYYWRVQAKKGSLVSQWSEVWYFTTAVIPLPIPPVLVSPAYDAKNQKIPVTLTWQSSGAAQSYGVQISTTTDFTQIVVNDSSPTNSYKASQLHINTTYYWRINAKNSAGTSLWSGAWVFTTSAVIDPVAPVLAAPPNEAINQPTTVTLVWNPVAGAQSYTVQVATTGAFNQNSMVAQIPMITVPSFSIPNLNKGMTYYWRVSTSMASGTSPYSAPFSFTIEPPAMLPAQVKLKLPANLAPVDIKQPILFAWDPAANATTYILQVALTADFTAPIVNIPNIATPYSVTTIPPTPVNTPYFWRVCGVNNSGQGPWSTPWVFNAQTGIDNDLSAITLPLDFRAKRMHTPGDGRIAFYANVITATPVYLRIFDIKGTSIFNGQYTIIYNKPEFAVWNMKNNAGSKVAAGTYYAILESVQSGTAKRMALIPFSVLSR